MFTRKNKRKKEVTDSAQIEIKNRLFIAVSVTIFPIMFLYYYVWDIYMFCYLPKTSVLENVDIRIMTVTGLFVALFTYLAVRFQKIHVFAPVNTLILVLVIIPELVSTSTQILRSGSFVWFVVSSVYIIIIFEDAIRILFLGIELLWAFAIYAVEYIATFNEPESFPYQNMRVPGLATFLASFSAFFIVCGIVIFIVSYQMRLQKEAMGKIRRQNEEIDSLNKAQTRFFSSMSHEIRTPINTIIGLNEVTLRENASPQINENAANIQSAGKMLLHLINDILDMSKIESGQMELSLTPYQTGSMLSDIVNMLYLRAKEKNLEFSVQVAPDLPQELIGDEMRIRQILINIINNAIKYTAEGSVSLSIECEKRDKEMANIVYSVTDTGMGIKKESIPYLFTAFKRVDEEKNKHIEGTGLGLSIVKELVDLMGGKITVNSIYTKGSTFIVEIPQRISNQDAIGTLNMKRHKDLSMHREYHQTFEAPDAKVLVVDDTAANLLVAKKLLSETKVQITTVGSGQAALQKTMENFYHVIFMDHLMPHMDGIECMHKIRNQIGGQCKNSAIIALTANAGEGSDKLYEREGFDAYLVKPVTGLAMENMLRGHLPAELVTLTGENKEILEESLSWSSGQKKKAPVLITTESVADLPEELAAQLGIHVLPHMVETTEGVFKDGIEIEQQGLLSYMEKRHASVNTKSPDVDAHEEFFARQLAYANHIVHISISSLVSGSGCPAAMEAAEAFDNVSVIDTGHLSSGQGLLAIKAAHLAREGKRQDEIIAKIEQLRSCTHTSFVVDNLDYLALNKQVEPFIARITKSLMMRPVLTLKKGKMAVGTIYFGSRERAWKKYISKVLNPLLPIDRSILFVTYVGLTQADLKKIKEQIDAIMSFDRIIFQKASPAIAVNCGPGTFGLLYMTEK